MVKRLLLTTRMRNTTTKPQNPCPNIQQSLDARMDSEFGNEQGGDAGGWDGNDEGGANNDGGAHVGMKMIWRT